MDDTIYRRDAIDAVKSYWKNEVDRIPKKSTDFDVLTQIYDSILTHNANICKAIDKLPSAQPERPEQPERKIGRWLELTNINHTYVCSVCGRMLVNITNGKNTVTKDYPFCHCGADMRGGQDGRDS